MVNSLRYIIPLLFLVTLSTCKGQTEPENNQGISSERGVIGGPFENGEFMYIGMPDRINHIDTSAAWNQRGQKILITGTLFKSDGKTPAADVLLYYYHTDTEGYYPNKQGLDTRVARHGYIRGWVKSNTDGNYKIYTVRPGAYPHRNDPAHIHLSIKEPGLDKEYYLDELVFDDDRLLTATKRKKMQNRGGSGVLRLLQKGDLQLAEHNIILGLNIPNYPGNDSYKNDSGINIGEDVFSFTPYHAWGPDKGTKTCPVCKYGRYHGLLLFVGEEPDWDGIKKWLNYLEGESAARKNYLKTYFIYGNPNGYSHAGRAKELEELGEALGLKYVALTFVPSFLDTASEVDLIKINPKVKNTILLYRHSNVIDKFVNLKANPSNFKMISNRLEETTNEFLGLPTLNMIDH